MNFPDIIAYFERIAVAHRHLSASYMGDYDRIYDVVANSDKYVLPALWIESPEMVPVGNADSVREQWSLSVVILHKGRNDNAEVNKHEIARSYETARDVLYRLIKDQNEGYHRFSIINKNISAIDPYSSDYLVGWRITIVIEVVNRTPCYTPSSWDESIGVTKGMAFVITETAGDIVIGAAVVPDTVGWTYAWTYSINGSAMVTVAGHATMSLDNADDNVYVVLTGTHTASGVVRVCSAFYQPGVAVITSVPYAYNLYKQS